ncbi:MAG: glucokinase [Gammaproteobacteria bacterium]|nr:glucokinase [Gammaproteobacteria bacterium]
MATQEHALLLVGDVGGTKTDLAIFAMDQGLRKPLARAHFYNADYADLNSIVAVFLKEAALAVDAACFDVAGPVLGGRARLTNLPWEVDAGALRETLGLQSVWVVNDLAAIAQAIPFLGPADLQVLNAGAPVAGGAIAVIAPGTGLGEAFLVWDGVAYRHFPSEGGHADFAPPLPEYMDLLRYMAGRLDHVSYELVCSGRGIAHLYDYFRSQGSAQDAPEFTAALAASTDPTPLIVESALGRGPSSPLSVAALGAFVTILGAEAGNLALKVLSTGGLFIGGGIPPRILPVLADGRFMAAFLRKGRFSRLLHDVPVSVIMNPDVALLGAAHYAQARWLKSPEGLPS